MQKRNKNKRECVSYNRISEENTVGRLFEVLKSRPNSTTGLPARLLNLVQHGDF